jgi:surfactin family lipopeptide synthetase A
MADETRLSAAKQKLLELRKRGLASSAPVQAHHTAGEPAPLSFSQEQVFRLDQTAGKLAPLYHESITIYRSGPCEIWALEASVAEIVGRHEIWRTTFELRDGQPVQIVHAAPGSFSLPVSDLRSLPETECEQKALDLATQDARAPFDLSRLPLFRLRLVTLRDSEHRLFLTAHQIIVDGMTVFDVFPSELISLYDSISVGKPSALLKLPAQSADFAVWQRRSVTGNTLQSQLEYWSNQLEGDLPALQWPNHGVRPDQQTFRGAIYPFSLGRELTALLKGLARQEGSTPFMILLAVLAALLHRYTSQTDIVIGTLSPCGRKRAEVQRLLGYFLNPVPLRVKLRGKPTFRSLFRHMREVTLGAISNDDVTLEMIAERIELKPDPSRSPLFTVALSVAPDLPPLAPGWHMTYMDVESGGARWDLYIELSDRTDGMIGRAQYNPDLFTRNAIQRTMDDLTALLRQVVEDPTQSIP